MSRSRSLVGSLLLVLTVGLVSTGLVTSPASAAREKLVQGVVVDQGGRPVLGVAVAAVDDAGKTVASDLSYENTNAAGDPQRGYFALHVGARGTFAIKLSKDGYVSRSISGVQITRKHPVASLGEITLTRKLVATETSGKLVDAEITTSDKGKVKVTVSPGKEKPVGDVVVRSGSKTVGSGDLDASDKGEVTITLQKLAKGSYDLKVVYTGSKFFKESTSGKLTLVVKAPKRHRPVPNALPFVG